jgi:hypothetical protein
MRYLYQKDKRALPGNLQNRRYSFCPPPNVMSLTTSPQFLSLLSLSLSCETRSRCNGPEGNNRRTVFSMWSVPRCYKQDSWSNELSSTREAVKIGPS